MEQHTDYSQENNLETFLPENNIETFIIFKFPNEEVFASVTSTIDINFLSNIIEQGVAYKPCNNCESYPEIEGYWLVVSNTRESIPSELNEFEYIPTEAIAFKRT